MHGLVGRFEQARGSVICGPRLGRDACAHGRMHGSVTTHGLVTMHVQIAHGLNFMDDWVMWLIYRNGHMQLKVKDM